MLLIASLRSDFFLLRFLLVLAFANSAKREQAATFARLGILERVHVSAAGDEIARKLLDGAPALGKAPARESGIDHAGIAVERVVEVRQRVHHSHREPHAHSAN